MGERLVRNEEAEGSNPFSSTRLFNNLDSFSKLHELPKLPNFRGSGQLKTETDLLRPHQPEVAVLGQFLRVACSRLVSAKEETAKT